MHNFEYELLFPSNLPIFAIKFAITIDTVLDLVLFSCIPHPHPAHPFVSISQVIVQDVDYNLLSFEEQIKRDLETDIMIGKNSHFVDILGFRP